MNTEACPGGTNHTDSDHQTSSCAAGYTGNLCGQCQNGYGTVKPFTCRLCLKRGTTIFLYTLAALVMLAVTRVLAAFAMADSGPQALPDQARPVDICKPLVLYAQYIFIVGNLGVPWPATLAVPLQAVAWFWSSSSPNSLGLDCVLPRTGMPIAAQKELFGLCMPLGILAVLLCIEWLYQALRSRRQLGRGRASAASLRTSLVPRFVSLFLCVAFLFLPTWIHSAMSLFACIPLDAEVSLPYMADAVGSFWAQDMSERCYALGGYHRTYALGLGIPLLMLLCFILPAGLLAFMWFSRRSGRLGTEAFRQQYGFLCRSWRAEVCWWEAVQVLSTIVLVMIGTFGFALGPYYQSLVITAALGISGVLLLAVRPHNCAAAGTVSLQSVGALITTSFSALTFLSYRNVTPAYGYTMFMGAVVLLVNVAFVLSAVWKLLRLIEWGSVAHIACSLFRVLQGIFAPLRQAGGQQRVAPHSQQK